MQHFLMVFYVLFFATGFMGGAALLILQMRMKSRLLRPLLVFQLLFLLGMGLILVIQYVQYLPGVLMDPVMKFLLVIATGINTAVWIIVLGLIRRIVPPRPKHRFLNTAAQIFAGLVVLKSAANMLMIAFLQSGEGAIIALTGTAAWNLGGHILTLLGMATFGLVARGPLNPNEPPALRPLIRAYGLCVIIFAPAGLIESLLQSSGIDWLATVSLDHLFYLAWNMVSMSAALKLFTPRDSGTPMLDSVPEERVKALGLSAREAEMAVMIGQGLANKEIADKLCISPATVRTHIYNLYRKAGAGSRVELLNKLRS